MGSTLTTRAVQSRRFTLEDVAREAGVSLATADRVVNRREGVRAPTIARVELAIDKLGYRANFAAARLARNRSNRFAFILPLTANPFMAQLANQVTVTADWLALQQGYIDIQHVDVFDPEALAAALDALPGVYDGVALVALDHPRVRVAIDALAARGIPIVTLVSDAPTARRVHYAGIDNPAAGRTAGTLLGRFCAGRSGKVGLIVGSMALRDHAERHFGFVQTLAGEFPELTVLPAIEGRDDPALTGERVEALLRQHPDITGLYNVGAGNEGIAAALTATGRRDLVWICHELTAQSRSWLVSGLADAVITQDAGHEARSAARVLLAHCEGAPILADQERIRIEIFIKNNLP